MTGCRAPGPCELSMLASSLAVWILPAKMLAPDSVTRSPCLRFDMNVSSIFNRLFKI